MKPFVWSPEKNAWLREQRGFGFEDVVAAIDDGRVLADMKHPSSRYPSQRILVVELGGYAIVVPYVEDESAMFLKTAFPDRKATRRYLGN